MAPMGHASGFEQRASQHLKHIPVDAFQVLAWWGRGGEPTKKQKHTHGGVFLLFGWKRACRHQKCIHVSAGGEGEGEPAKIRNMPIRTEESLWTVKTHPCEHIFVVRRSRELGLGGLCGGCMWEGRRGLRRW